VSADIVRGARVRILTGAAGGRTGTVVNVYQGRNGPLVDVEHARPELLTVPDGPIQVVRLPYAPIELEVVEPESTPALAAELDEPDPGAYLRPDEEPTAIARVKRHRAPSGNRDADYFQPVCDACGWEDANYSNRTVEGRSLAEKRAAEHRCRAIATPGGTR